MSAETAHKSGQTVGVRCPSCAAALKIARTLMGRKLRCPLCGQAFRPREQNEATVAVPTMMGDYGDFPPPVAPLSVSDIPHTRSDTVDGTAVVSPNTPASSEGLKLFGPPAGATRAGTGVARGAALGADAGAASTPSAPVGQGAPKVSAQVLAVANREPKAAPAAVGSPNTSKPDPLLGQKIKHFLVRHVLGRGAMGTVYEAEDTILRRKIALKVLAPKLVARNNHAALERFLIEARAAAALSHPNIVYIHEIGVDDKGDASYAYIAMELVRGGSAADYIDEFGPMSPANATRVIIESARALGEAHVNGVVHRDVKPDNIMIGPDWLVKVTDFGLAKRVDENEDIGTKGKALGTPGYMSPETCRGLDTDARSDIYSLGATYYCLLVGKPPFRGDNVRLILRRHLTEQGPDPRLERPDIPAECAAVIRRAMELDPLKRYQTAREMIADLQAIRFDLPADGAASHQMQDWAEQAAEAQDAVSVAGSQEDIEILAMAIPERKGFGSGNPLGSSGHRTVATTQARVHGGNRPVPLPTGGSSRVGAYGASADLSELAAAAEALSKSAPIPSTRVGSSTSGLNRVPANLKSNFGTTRAVPPGKSGEMSHATLATSAGAGELRGSPGPAGIAGQAGMVSLPGTPGQHIPANGGVHLSAHLSADLSAGGPLAAPAPEALHEYKSSSPPPSPEVSPSFSDSRANSPSPPVRSVRAGSRPPGTSAPGVGRIGPVETVGGFALPGQSLGSNTVSRNPSALSTSQLRPVPRVVPLAAGRSPGHSGVPITVVLIGTLLLLVIIGLLVWRPWAEDPPAPPPTKKPSDEVDELMVNPDFGPAGAASKVNPPGTSASGGPLALGSNPSGNSSPNSTTAISAPVSGGPLKQPIPGTTSPTTTSDAVPSLTGVPPVPTAQPDPAKIEAIGRELAQLIELGNQFLQQNDHVATNEVIEKLEQMASQYTGSPVPAFANFGRNAASEALRLRRFAGTLPAEQSGILVLFEDNVKEFAAHFSLFNSNANIQEETAGPFSGNVAVRVTPIQVFNAKVPAWNFPIRHQPKKDEYRYLRFAWKKQGGNSITIQLAHNGSWGGSTSKSSRRYYAGSEMPYPAVKVSDTLPTEWVLVTCDLAADFGVFTLTGISLTPHDGEAGYFDHIVLGRNLLELDNYTSNIRRH